MAADCSKGSVLSLTIHHEPIVFHCWHPADIESQVRLA
jgi:hypothetical protein